MNSFIESIKEGNEMLIGVSNWVIVLMLIVGGLLILLSIFAAVVSAILAIKYVRFNHTKNSAQKTGAEIARDVLDKNGLQDVRVSKNGSLLFGNSYSHFFKKVRLRRLTWQKKSVSSMAMAVQKSSLAVMDKNGDKDMKKRIVLTPITYFGPLAFIPLILVGLFLDIIVFKTQTGIATIVCTLIGLAFYIVSFVMSIMILKTEKKAQKLALEIMKNDQIANDEEIEMCKELFTLYNIEYINNMITALLELVYRVLQIVANLQNNKAISKK